MVQFGRELHRFPKERDPLSQIGFSAKGERSHDDSRNGGGTTAPPELGSRYAPLLTRKVLGHRGRVSLGSSEHGMNRN